MHVDVGVIFVTIYACDWDWDDTNKRFGLYVVIVEYEWVIESREGST